MTAVPAAVPAARRRGARSGHQRGLTTAEYALGTGAVVTGVGVLVALLAGPDVPLRVFWPVLEPLVRVVLRSFGISLG